jgi:hypothetical protein
MQSKTVQDESIPEDALYHFIFAGFEYTNHLLKRLPLF